jgi:hypothetical protein
MHAMRQQIQPSSIYVKNCPLFIDRVFNQIKVRHSFYLDVYYKYNNIDDLLIEEHYNYYFGWNALCLCGASFFLWWNPCFWMGFDSPYATFFDKRIEYYTNDDKTNPYYLQIKETFTKEAESNKRWDEMKQGIW